ncbi:TetR family transcriptional regulator [Dactylosporangium sp. CA-139114]|uniref:TetR family transcriptional regulator n=1 Tax=Dactylosporangium sp. CA-139114 TaxID=3239931 RepID=UPI003D96C0A3
MAVTLGTRMRAARQRRGLSVRALADRLGVSAATISAIENDRTGVSVQRLLQLAAALDVSTGFLLHNAPAAQASEAPRAWRVFGPSEVDPVLAAAIEEFVRAGYHGTTMRTIAARAGMSIPGIYHHYESKQALLVRILDLTMDELDWRIREATADADGPLTRLARLVEALALFHTSRPELAFIGASEMRSIDEPDRGRVAARRDAVQHRIDQEITHAVERGDAHTAMPLETGRAIATMCTSLPQWFDPAGPTSPAEIAREYAGLALRMIGAEAA